MMTFTADVRALAYVQLAFTWKDDGRISMKPTLIGMPALTYVQEVRARHRHRHLHLHLHLHGRPCIIVTARNRHR